MNLFSNKATFEDVLSDIEAVRYHAERFDNGHRYTLARQCYDFMQKNGLIK